MRKSLIFIFLAIVITFSGCRKPDFEKPLIYPKMNGKA